MPARLRLPLVFLVPNVLLTVIQNGCFNLLLNLTVSLVRLDLPIPLAHSLLIVDVRSRASVV